MSLNANLTKIRKELTPIPRSKIMADGVSRKLGRSEKNYEKTVEANCRYILSRSNYKALMAVDRYEKYKEKNNETESSYGFIEII